GLCVDMKKSPEPLQRSSKLLARLSLSIAVLLAAAPAAKAGPLDHWQVRAPLPTGDSLGDVVYGNGAFVAVGSGVCSWLQVAIMTALRSALLRSMAQLELTRTGPVESLCA